MTDFDDDALTPEELVADQVDYQRHAAYWRAAQSLVLLAKRLDAHTAKRLGELFPEMPEQARAAIETLGGVDELDDLSDVAGGNQALRELLFAAADGTGWARRFVRLGVAETKSEAIDARLQGEPGYAKRIVGELDAAVGNFAVVGLHGLSSQVATLLPAYGLR